MSDDDRLVRPNGLTVRRLRHERAWSPRKLIERVAEVSFESTGLRRTITPSVLNGIEEHEEEVPYDTLCLLAGALDCDPVDLWSERSDDEEEDDEDPSAQRSEPWIT